MSLLLKSRIIAGLVFSLSIVLFDSPVISPLRAEGAQSSDGQVKALLISIGDYDKNDDHLDYCKDDLERLSVLLQTRYNAVSQAILDVPPALGKEEEKYRDGVKEKIQDWCNSLQPADTAVLYLAGHGVESSSKMLYYPMINYNSDNLEGTAIPVSWIREEFSRAKSDCKVILIDTCFSGTDNIDSKDGIAKGVEYAVSADEMVSQFENLDRTVTIASSKKSQRSWISRNLESSLFTYWVIEGFRGNADGNGDLIITFDELYRYVKENVSEYSKNNLPEIQEPVVLGSDEVQNNFQMKMRACKTGPVIEDIAGQIVKNACSSDTVELMIVPEFATRDDGSITPEYGSLPRSIANKMIDAIVIELKKSDKKYKVLNLNLTGEMVKDNDIKISDYGTKKTRELENKGVKVKYIVSGNIYFNTPETLQIEVKLIDNESGEETTNAKGTALLTSSDLSHAGVSFVKPSSRPNQNPQLVAVEGIGFTSEEDIQNLREIQEQIQLENGKPAHPILDGKLPYSIEFLTRSKGSNGNYTPREGKLIGKDYCVPFEGGEEYEIRITNNSDNRVFARVLVDGLNTLSQPVPGSEDGKEEWAPFANLESARPWVLWGKNRPAGKSNVNVFQGFYEFADGKQKVHLFEYTDDDQETMAARRGYTEHIGLITIALYKDPGTRGTTSGRDANVDLLLSKFNLENDKDPDVVYNIRYMSKKEFEKLNSEAVKAE